MGCSPDRCMARYLDWIDVPETQSVADVSASGRVPVADARQRQQSRPSEKQAGGQYVATVLEHDLPRLTAPDAADALDFEALGAVVPRKAL